MYTPESGEVLSDAKLMRILDRVPVLAAYFKHYVEGKSKMDAQEIVANGSLYFALWIGQMAKEFIIDKARRQVTQYEDVDGVSTPNRLHILVPKKRYQFGKFNMGQNRRVQSIMQDQKIRARATVWLRINSKKTQGKPINLIIGWSGQIAPAKVYPRLPKITPRWPKITPRSPKMTQRCP